GLASDPPVCAGRIPRAWLRGGRGYRSHEAPAGDRPDLGGHPPLVVSLRPDRVRSAPRDRANSRRSTRWPTTVALLILFGSRFGDARSSWGRVRSHEWQSMAAGLLGRRRFHPAGPRLGRGAEVQFGGRAD